jgi:hypothetical protein
VALKSGSCGAENVCMTLLLQLAAVWAVLSLFAAVGCSLLFRGAAACAAQPARRVASAHREPSGHAAA